VLIADQAIHNEHSRIGRPQRQKLDPAIDDDTLGVGHVRLAIAPGAVADDHWQPRIQRPGFPLAVRAPLTRPPGSGRDEHLCAGIAQAERRPPRIGVGADEQPDVDPLNEDRRAELAGRRPPFAARGGAKLPVPAEHPPVTAEHEQAVEELPAHGVALWMADEADDSELGAEVGEPAQPGVRLLGDPVGPDQRGEAIAGHDQLAGQDPLGPEAGGNTGAGLDQRPVPIERAEHWREMQERNLQRPRHLVSPRRPRAPGRLGG
jgi:hypothetical protein